MHHLNRLRQKGGLFPSCTASFRSSCLYPLSKTACCNSSPLFLLEIISQTQPRNRFLLLHSNKRREDRVLSDIASQRILRDFVSHGIVARKIHRILLAVRATSRIQFPRQRSYSCSGKSRILLANLNSDLGMGGKETFAVSLHHPSTPSTTNLPFNLHRIAENDFAAQANHSIIHPSPSMAHEAYHPQQYGATHYPEPQGVGLGIQYVSGLCNFNNLRDEMLTTVDIRLPI